MGKIVRNADEAAKCLVDLVNNNPQAFNIHFEFDLEAGNVPRVRYTVERFAYTETEEDEYGN